MLIFDGDLCVLTANRAYCREFESTAPEIERQTIAHLSNGLWNVPQVLTLLADTLAGGPPFEYVEARVGSRITGQRTMCLGGCRLSLPGSGKPSLALSIVDITVPETAQTIRSDEQTQDKKIALALQRPMLFQPKEDAFSGMTVHTSYAMASEEALVGGDFWDTFAFNRRHIALVIGDVMGHCLSSAIFTTELKHTMRAYIREHEQPVRILYQMNEFLYQSNRLFLEGINTEGSDSPVCLALAIVERDTGLETLAIAGMEGPILVRTNGETEQATLTGLPLGIRPNEEYEQIDFQLAAGDTIATDHGRHYRSAAGPPVFEYRWIDSPCGCGA